MQTAAGMPAETKVRRWPRTPDERTRESGVRGPPPNNYSSKLKDFWE